MGVLTFMGYTFKQYGKGFRILGKMDGWHYGIWEDSMPPVHVFLKPINKNDFVFCCIDQSQNNKLCGCLELNWFRCLDNEFAEIKKEEAQMLLDTKLNQFEYIPKVGETIFCRDIYSENETYKCTVKDLIFEETDILILCCDEYGYDECVYASNYDYDWFIQENPYLKNIE